MISLNWSTTVPTAARWLNRDADIDVLTAAATALTLSLALCVALQDARVLVG